MNLKVLLPLMILSFLGCGEKKISPLDLANQIVEKYENQKSLSYDIDYKIKFFSQIEDTTKNFARIDLIRESSDSVFGGYVWINSDSIDRYYNTQNTYFIDHRNKLITKYPKEIYFAITGNTIGEAIRIYFLKPERLINGATDSTINITIKDQNLNGKKQWKLAYEFEDDGDYINTWKKIWIEKDDFFIPKMIFSSDYQGENQYNQWDLSNMSYDNVTVNDLEQRFEILREKYALNDYKERSEEEARLLSNGTKMPALSGTRHSDKATITLSDYIGKLVLLDFWYIDCPPCIKAIPHLNDLNNKYKDKGLVVIGANPFNDNEKDLKRMPNFLSNNPVDYPIIYIDETKPEEFKIYAYPSFYIIDKQGKIIHSEVGFNEGITNKIDSIIRMNL